jgi:hypothetical protein
MADRPDDEVLFDSEQTVAPNGRWVQDTSRLTLRVVGVEEELGRFADASQVGRDRGDDRVRELPVVFVCLDDNRGPPLPGAAPIDVGDVDEDDIAAKGYFASGSTS